MAKQIESEGQQAGKDIYEKQRIEMLPAVLAIGSIDLLGKQLESEALDERNRQR